MRRVGPAALEVPAVVEADAGRALPAPMNVAPVEEEDDDAEARRAASLRRAVARRFRLLSPHGREDGLAKAFAALQSLTDAAGRLNIADLFTGPIAALWDALPPPGQ
jgi:hypothetical protein